MAERRGEEEIRRELAATRAQLAAALEDLRSAAGRRRERTAAVGRAAAGGLALAGLLRGLQRLRRR